MCLKKWDFADVWFSTFQYTLGIVKDILQKRSIPLHLVDDQLWGDGRRCPDGQVNVIWHDLHSLYLNAELLRFLLEQFPQLGFQCLQHWSPVLWTEDDMIMQAVDRMCCWITIEWNIIKVCSSPFLTDSIQQPNSKACWQGLSVPCDSFTTGF